MRGEGEEHARFLRAIDAVKKRTQRALRRSRNLNDVVPDDRDEADQARVESRDAVPASGLRAIQSPTAADCANELRWLVSQRDRDPASHSRRNAVSDEKYKAIRKLRVSFCEAE